MAEYDTFKYGDGTKYGSTASTKSGDITWIVSVDWNDDGNYDGENEAEYLTGYSMTRGRRQYLAGDGSGFEPMSPGSMTLTLDNKDRRYDPRNTSSPLYPNIVPGRRIQVSAFDNANLTGYVRFTGVIDDIIPQIASGGGEVVFECVSYHQLLLDQELTASAAMINTTISAALRRLLTDAGYPGPVDIDEDTQPVYVFGPDRAKAGDTAQRLADAAIGVFFESANGTAKFYSRDHNYGTPTDLDEDYLLNTPELTQPWDEVYYKTTVVAHRIIRRQPAVIYFLPAPQQLVDNTAVIYPRYSPSVDLVVSDWTANSAADDSGDDISGNTTKSASLRLTAGTVTFTNSSDAGYITGMEIRGRTLDDIQEEYTSTSDAVRRQFWLDTPYLQDPAYGQAFVDIIDDWIDGDHEGVTVEIEHRPDLQFGFDLMDAVALTIGTYDIDDTYYVQGIDERWTKGAEGVVTKLYLRKIITDSTSITPVGIDEEKMQAPLGYDNPAGDRETTSAVASDPDDIFSQIMDDFLFIEAPGAYNPPLYATFTYEYLDTGDLFDTGSNTVINKNPGLYHVSFSGAARWYLQAGQVDNIPELEIELRLFDSGDNYIAGWSAFNSLLRPADASPSTYYWMSCSRTVYVPDSIDGTDVAYMKVYCQFGSEISGYDKINQVSVCMYRISTASFDFREPP